MAPAAVLTKLRRSRFAGSDLAESKGNTAITSA
jgi:hypothetical protein